MSEQLSEISPYLLLASCLMMAANGCAFLFGVWDYSRFLSDPDRSPSEPLIPNKPLFVAFITTLGIFLLTLAAPLIGPHDEHKLRFMLAVSILMFAGTAIPCWHLVFAKQPGEPEPPRPTWKFYVAATGGLIVWNAAILFANPELEIPENNPLNHANLEHPVILFLFVLIALCAPVSEEIVYRGVIQTWAGKIAKSALFGGIVAGLLFAIAHAGMVSNPGVKELQVLGLAALFGWARWRYRLTTSIALHFINNAMALILHLIDQVFGLGTPPLS